MWKVSTLSLSVQLILLETIHTNEKTTASDTVPIIRLMYTEKISFQDLFYI